MKTIASQKIFLISKVNDMVKEFGKKEAGNALYYALVEKGWYMSDKRKSKIQFALNVISHNYSSYDEDIEEALNFALKICRM